MAVLTIDSISQYGAPISPGLARAAVATPEPIGEKSRAFAGNLRNSIRGQKKNWQVLTVPLEPAMELDIRNRIVDERFLTCNGDLFDNVATVCSISLAGSELMAGVTIREMQLVITAV